MNRRSADARDDPPVAESGLPATASPAAFFPSILSPDGVRDTSGEARDAPAYFRDLNLDRVVASVTASRVEYDLAPLFHARLTDVDAVLYRQEVMRDVESHDLRRAIAAFAERMRTTRHRLPAATQRLHELERQRWLLAAAESYTDAVEGLARDLAGVDLASRGLCSFRIALAAYAGSDAFRALAGEARAVAGALAEIRFAIHIRGGAVTVRRFEDEVDLGTAVEETFRKFQEGAGKEFRNPFGDVRGMNHVEAQIAERVALLFPGAFAALAALCARHADFVEPGIARFEREVQFYAAWLDHVDRLRAAGLSFCFPEVSATRKDVFARDTFDVALAETCLREKRSVVCNDFYLGGGERLLVVTGPNQGGKTTFARTFGQIHHLAALGCPLPGREARLFLCDRILTHFEREERIATLRGKLEDDLVRIRAVLGAATGRSVVVVNEIFSSTTAEDAVWLGRQVFGRMLRLDLLCVCVTFLDELATLGEKTVSMVARVDPADPTRRTFKIERRRPDGLAYALALAEKHRVTYRRLLERLPG